MRKTAIRPLWKVSRPQGNPLGFTVIEAVLVLLLSSLVLSAGWKIFSTALKAGVQVADRVEGLETVRLVTWILTEELRGALPGRDRWAAGTDSVSLRAYRGLALVEGQEPGGGLKVCYRGLRSPNPAKDTVLFLTERGRWEPRRLEARVKGKAGCLGGGEGWTEVWEVSPEIPGALVGRVFERGSYHLKDGAFRYRRGGGGRQPLTPPRIGPAGFGAETGEGGPLTWWLVLSDPAGLGDTIPWTGWVR